MQTWAQADQNTVMSQPLDQYGWELHNESLTITWDTAENMKRVKNAEKLWTSGCNCKKGTCHDKRCGCFQNSKICNVTFCKCSDKCKNVRVNDTSHTIANSEPTIQHIVSGSAELQEMDADEKEYLLIQDQFEQFTIGQNQVPEQSELSLETVQLVIDET